MGGRPKGLLPAPDTGEPLVVRTARLARALSMEVVLVGRADAYQALLPDVPVLRDLPEGVGPLGGLNALLQFARTRSAFVLVVACDLPFIDASLLTRLRDDDSGASVLAPRAAIDAPWEALLARYHVEQCLPVLEQALSEGVRSFQALFARLDVQPFVLKDLDQLRDWDSPEDVDRS
jgi:molybdopterin-guanine dinucleotide biosynthesis protein A